MSVAIWNDIEVFLTFERLPNVPKSVQCFLRRKIKAEHFVSLKNILIHGC